MIKKPILQILLAAAALSACSGTKNGTMKSSVHELSASPLSFTWTHGTGTIAHDHAYAVAYTVNFQSNDLAVSSYAGSAVTTPLPRNKTIRLSKAQIETVQNYLSLITVNSCPTGNVVAGGSQDKLNVISNNQSLNIYNTNCSGLVGAANWQAVSGFDALTTYIQSL